MLPVLASGDKVPFTWLAELLPFLNEKSPLLGDADGKVGNWQTETLLLFGHSCLAALIILAMAWVARMAMMRTPAGREGLVPDGSLTPRNVFELFTEALLEMCRGVLGKDAERYFPLIAGLFLYIFVSNILGIFPGFVPPTEDINTNIPMALCIFVIYNTVIISIIACNAVTSFINDSSSKTITSTVHILTIICT